MMDKSCFAGLARQIDKVFQQDILAKGKMYIGKCLQNSKENNGRVI
jgi:hypothetical protein